MYNLNYIIFQIGHYLFNAEKLKRSDGKVFSDDLTKKKSG